ncbi:DUF7009 family protein [Taibaiella chishuiensis]|uniref:Uncharacterized protein n=1 Tax=Taibaiella chishuiensis TaxID=1434707 RepID=A0A2P8CV22_9BACT|nr:hypothetical protein [Taibaiella chishuiensis]PSK88810.1 hypothetical protein B0I18_11421 [Taibaiella chishuiensis]
MKIRIKGNSVRYRLSKTDVTILVRDGYHEEHTVFATGTLTYALQRKEAEEDLTATYTGNKITLYLSAAFLKDWETNAVIGCDARMPLNDKDSLYLLVEKDFKCLDDTTEDQSDNYDNPNQTC